MYIDLALLLHLLDPLLLATAVFISLRFPLTAATTWFSPLPAVVPAGGRHQLQPSRVSGEVS